MTIGKVLGRFCREILLESFSVKVVGAARAVYTEQRVTLGSDKRRDTHYQGAAGTVMPEQD